MTGAEGMLQGFEPELTRHRFRAFGVEVPPLEWLRHFGTPNHFRAACSKSGRSLTRTQLSVRESIAAGQVHKLGHEGVIAIRPLANHSHASHHLQCRPENWLPRGE
jgi:hypothetical protein